MWISKAEYSKLETKIYLLESDRDHSRERIRDLQDKLRECQREQGRIIGALKMLGIERVVQKADIVYHKVTKSKKV